MTALLLSVTVLIYIYIYISPLQYAQSEYDAPGDLLFIHSYITRVLFVIFSGNFFPRAPDTFNINKFQLRAMGWVYKYTRTSKWLERGVLSDIMQRGVSRTSVLREGERVALKSNFSIPVSGGGARARGTSPDFIRRLGILAAHGSGSFTRGSREAIIPRLILEV